MGMFDYVVCEMNLPGTVPAWIKSGHKFQTKDTPNQYLDTYSIAADGAFSGPDADNFTGVVEFYTSNICGSGPGIYTDNGEDGESVCFNAVIVSGRVSVLTQTNYNRQPALSLESEPLFTRPTAEQVAASKARDAESLLDRSLYVLYGGQESGYAVTVIAENERQLVVQLTEASKYAKVGSFEILDRRSRDTTFFDSEYDAMADKNKRGSDWAARKKRYDDYAAEWQSKGGAR